MINNVQAALPQSGLNAADLVYEMVTESGITGPRDVARMRSAGVNAFLVGEAFMRFDEPGVGLRELFFTP